jgi:hypothetical protein
VVTFHAKDLSKLAMLMFVVARKLRLVKVHERVVDDDLNASASAKKVPKTIQYESSNFTIINFYLTIVGPTNEKWLTIHLLILQVNFCFVLTFGNNLNYNFYFLYR